MNKPIKNEFQQISFYLYVLLLMAAFIFLFHQGLQPVNDTASYLSFEPYRSPLYPWLLHLLYPHQSLLLLLQLMVSYISIIIVSEVLQRHFALPHWIKYTIVLATIAYALFIGKYANLIETEGLSFGLFLLDIAAIIQWLDKPKYRFIIYQVILLYLLILLRPQLMILAIASLCLPLLIWQTKKLPWHLCLAMFIIFIIVFLGARVTDKIYHSTVNQAYTSDTISGGSFLVQPIFFATADDANLFTGAEKIYFQSVYQQLQQRQFISGQVFTQYIQTHPGVQHPVFHSVFAYEENYNQMLWQILYPTALKTFPLEQVNSELNHIALVLLEAHPKNNGIFYTVRWLNAFSNQYFLLAVFLLIASLFLFKQFLASARTLWQNFGIIIFIIYYLNTTVNVFFNIFVPRVSIYSDWLLMIWLIILLNYAFTKKGSQ